MELDPREALTLMDVLKNFIAEGIIVLPFVLTFHSLAYRIMQPDNILVDVDDDFDLFFHRNFLGEILGASMTA